MTCFCFTRCLLFPNCRDREGTKDALSRWLTRVLEVGCSEVLLHIVLFGLSRRCGNWVPRKQRHFCDLVSEVVVTSFMFIDRDNYKVLRMGPWTLPLVGAIFGNFNLPRVSFHFIAAYMYFGENSLEKSI